MIPDRFTLLTPPREPMTDTKRSAAEVIEAVTRAGGVKAAAAGALGVSRPTLDAYLDRWPEARAAYDDANEATLDAAEGGLAAFVAGELPGDDGPVPVEPRLRLDAIKFLLRTKGKGRGYTERAEVEQSGAVGVKHSGAGPTVAVLAKELRDDPEYLDFLRSRAVLADARVILPDNGRGDVTSG